MTNGMMNGASGPEMSLLVPQKLAQSILNYLQQRPFAEVFEMIQALVQCQVQQAPNVPTEAITVPSA